MIWVTGDYHGGAEAAKLLLENFPPRASSTREDYLIILGDLGLPWDGSVRDVRAMGALAAAPWTTLFIDGNHENFDYLDSLPQERWHGGTVQRLWGDLKLPSPADGQLIENPADVLHLMRGQVYDLDGARVFCMGGASSIDAGMRTEGVNWFAREMPSAAEYAEAERNLEQAGWEVDYVLTHCCSTAQINKVCYPDPAFRALVTDELTEWMSGIEGRLRFKRWYFGHHHYTRDPDASHTLLFNAVLPLGMSVAQARAAGRLFGFPEQKGY